MHTTLQSDTLSQVATRLESTERDIAWLDQLITAERTALNFLQLLSGTATVTRRHVEAVAGASPDAA